jgi:hypothetical protein
MTAGALSNWLLPWRVRQRGIARSINPKSICDVGDGYSGRCQRARSPQPVRYGPIRTSVAWTDTIAFEPSAERAQIVVPKIESGRSRPRIRFNQRAQGQFCCARAAAVRTGRCGGVGIVAVKFIHWHFASVGRQAKFAWVMLARIR